MKKGFTLVELLAVVALIAIIAVFAVPNALKIFSSSKNELTKIQKDQLKMSTELYISDYCTNPISDCYSCPFETEYDSINDKIILKGAINIPLSDLIESENACNEKTSYIEDAVLNNCSGKIKIINNEIDLSSVTCNFNE